ncbi:MULTISPECIES: hypothetical protein [unclassified Sphingomonas]|uniref:hypothetical protein n=1 Tax=Novosphingobium rhizosphaerae TaxID=1551649 RepID=UPI0015CAF397
MTILRAMTLLMAVAGLGPAAGRAAPERPVMLPNRVFTCTMGHITNFDAHKAQTPADLTFDSHHRLVFALPAGPARTRPAPDVNDPPEKVPAGARILEDPDAIAPQRRAAFDQVVDYWPRRVETMGMIDTHMRNAMVIEGLSPDSANVFMLRASELTHFDPQHLYQGHCRVSHPASLPVSQR